MVALANGLREEDKVPMGPGITSEMQGQTAWRRPDLSAEGLLKFANTLRGATGPGSPGPTRIVTPDAPAAQENRLDPVDIEREIRKHMETPVDYTKVGEVGRSRLAEGRRNFLGALAMANSGGAEEQPLAKALFEKSLAEREGLRANAADVGYTNPETVEFVVNPELERSRKDKLLQGRLDARIKEEQARATLALKQTGSDRGEFHKQQDEYIKLLTAAIAAGRTDLTPLLAQMKAEAAAAKAAEFKRLGLGEQKQLQEMGSTKDTMDRLFSSFKPEYAGGWTGSLGAETESSLVRNFPKAMGAIPGYDVKPAKARAEWWAAQKYWDELPERHELFGATLTTGEKEAWRGAAINQGMEEKEIKANLKLRQDLANRAIARAREMHIQNRINPAAIDAATGASVPGAPSVRGSTPKPNRPSLDDPSLQR